MGLAASMVTPSRAWSQVPPKHHRIGVLLITSRTHPGADRLMAPFLERMKVLGYVEGSNLQIEWREADGRLERLPALAAELAALKVALIVAGGPDAATAAKKATATIPIVFIASTDPVQQGLVHSLARPGGNATGLAGYTGPSGAKLLELLLEASPRARRVAVIYGESNTPNLPELRDAAERLGASVQFHGVRSEADLDAALRLISGDRTEVLVVLSDTIIYVHRTRIAQFAVERRLPSVYQLAQHVEAGGLMSYGVQYADNWRRSADYVDKILKGVKPGDLPVQQPTQFELVVNLATARSIGVTIPKSILSRADRVIE